MSRFMKLASPPPGISRTWRDYVTLVLIFGCIPGLALSIICWLLALVFTGAGALPVLITVLLVLVSVVLVITLADEAGIQYRMYVIDPTRINSRFQLWKAHWIISICLGLLLCDTYCLFHATRLEVWHYILAGGEILLIGFQTWRALRRRGYSYY